MLTRFTSALDYLRTLCLRAIVKVTHPLMHRFLPDPYTAAGNERVKFKPMYESRVTMTEIISTADANIKGLAYAGVVLGWMDIAAGIAAKRHASVPSVTRSVDDVAFLYPIHVGDILTIQASVNKSWKTSMEVGVKVEAESPMKAGRFFVAHAYFTFVALSPRPVPRSYLGRKLIEHHPISVPEIIPDSEMEKKRHEMAERRRLARFKRERHTYENIRVLMSEWSQGRHKQATDDAPIPHYSRTRVNGDDGTGSDEQDEHLRATLSSARRRYSTELRLVQQTEAINSESTFAEVVELVMPQHANTLSITFGGQIMAWMETCALVSANRLAKAYLLSVSIDSLNFIIPTHVGDVVTVRSIVSRTFTSSMEVYVTVEAENLQTGEINFTNDGFFTIAAVDAEIVPVMIPAAIPVSDAEKELHEGSLDRRRKRLKQRQELMDLIGQNASYSPSPMTSPITQEPPQSPFGHT